MEAGFAAASEGEIEAIKLIADAGLRSEVYSMARGVTSDIDAVLKTGAEGVHLVDARRGEAGRVVQQLPEGVAGGALGEVVGPHGLCSRRDDSNLGESAPEEDHPQGRQDEEEDQDRGVSRPAVRAHPSEPACQFSAPRF